MNLDLYKMENIIDYCTKHNNIKSLSSLDVDFDSIKDELIDKAIGNESDDCIISITDQLLESDIGDLITKLKSFHLRIKRDISKYGKIF